MAGLHVVVDIGGGHLDGLAQPTGGEGDGAAAAQVLGGGKQAAGVYRAHLALDGYAHVGKVPQGGAAPVGARGGQLDLLPRLDGQGGEGAGAARAGDLKLGEPVHHVDLGVALQLAGGEAEVVGARLPASGVNPVVDSPQPVHGGVLQVPQAGGNGVEELVHCHGFGQGQGGASQEDQAVFLGGQPLGGVAGAVAGHQQQVGGTAPGPSV